MADPKNPLAFPYEGRGPSHHDREPGMSLRDWFAGQALIASGSLPSGYGETHARHSVLCRERAAEIYRMADAMLSAREGQSGGRT